MSCFHCGLNIHEIKTCPSLLRGEEQSQSGKDAQQAFYDARKKWRKEHGKCKKPKSKIHNYLAIREYLQPLTTNPENVDKCEFMDPIELIKMNPKESCSPNRTQRAVLEFFNYIMDIFLQELIAIFEQTDDSVDFKDIVRNYRHKNENNPWVYVLNEAVKEGNPADFSDHEKNRYYTIQKLATRTRYLNLLIMDDNNICRDVRNLLSDRLKASDDDGCGKRRRNIHVASVGGGPGYDHIAIWIVFLFIYNMNDGFIDSGSITLTTDVYDLYGEWKDIVKAMNQSMTNTLRIISETDRSEVKTNLFEGNGARMKLCDIREGLDSPVNKELSDSLEQTDIICFSFVIHENASIILSKDENDPLIQGAARDIMERSRIGTIMICTDSNNTCWPSFKATAECFGWRYLGSSEKSTGIPFGPKECVVFQRVQEAYPCSQYHNA